MAEIPSIFLLLISNSQVKLVVTAYLVYLVSGSRIIRSEIVLEVILKKLFLNLHKIVMVQERVNLDFPVGR